MRTSAIFGTKTSDFLKFMVCSHRQGGVVGLESVRIFCVQGGGSFFAIFVRTTSVMEGLEPIFFKERNLWF